MLTFHCDSVEELNADLISFDPFDPHMSNRDKRDVADTYGSPIAWRALADVAECLAYAERSGGIWHFDAMPRGRSR
jgi:hypothetical protein